MVNGGPNLLEKWGGPVIQDFAVAGTKVEQVPQVATAVGVRISPPIWGDGLLEVVAEKDILAQMAPSKQKFDLGIRGIANWQDGKIGRFGWKGQKPDLKIFTEQAYDWEMGISTPDRPMEQVPNAAPRKTKHPDISKDEELDVVFYQRYLDAPPRGPSSAESQHGEQVFKDTGCVYCHIHERSSTGGFANERSSPITAWRRTAFSPRSSWFLVETCSSTSTLRSRTGPSA